MTEPMTPEEPFIRTRPQYVRLGAVLIAMETSKSLREALKAIHDLKAEEFPDIRAAVAAEREACASYAECFDLGTPEGHKIAAAIRERGQS
jgi:hypothetical protein